MSTSRRRDQILPLLGLLLGGGLLALVCLATPDGARPWAGYAIRSEWAGWIFAPYLLLGLAGLSLGGALLATLGEDLSGQDRLLGVTLASGLAILVAPELALAVAGTAVLTALVRRHLAGGWLAPLGGLLTSAAALATGALVTRATVDGTGILAAQLPRLDQPLTWLVPGWEVRAAAALLLTWGAAAGALTGGPLLRRLGALAAGLVVVGAAPLILHDAPWTFRWGGHIHTLPHMAYLAVLFAGLRAVTTSGGLEERALGDHLACCGLLLTTGLVLGPGSTLAGALLGVILFVATLDRRRSRERDDLRWRKPRRLRTGAGDVAGAGERPARLQA